MKSRQTRLTLLGLGLGILLALLLAPQTRWLVRAQLFPLMLLPGRCEPQRRLFVQAHPGDYQVQLAGKESSVDSQTEVQYARSLVPRFPASASLRASILRYATLKEVRLSRDEDNLLSGQPVPVHHSDPNNLPPTAAALAAFDADAAAGERLDPDNAYFPLMRAFGLFAARRDTEGLAAVQRASEKHVWREYLEDEVQGRWRINDAVYGGREAVSAGAVSASVLFPQYQHLRAAARVVVYKAILDEQAGHFEAGLAKRKALGRCGELMGVQATSIIGNLVGIAINSISRSRPGGVPPVKYDSKMPGEMRVAKNLSAYCVYVTKIGHPEAAAEARKDYQNWQQIRRVTSSVNGLAFGIGLAAFIRLSVALVGGLAILSNVVSVFLLGLLAAGLSRLPQIRANRPLPAGTTTGFWAAVLTGLALAAAFVNDDPADFPLSGALVAAAPLVLAGLLAGLLPRLRRSVAAALVSAAVTVSVLGLYAALMTWQEQGGANLAQTLRETLSLSNISPESGALSDSQTALIEALSLAAITFVLPLLAAIILSIRSRVKRVPVSVGLVTGFQSVMPPLMFGLMLVYGGLTLWTLPQEARANYGLERSLHGEGQYLAQRTGEKWPER